MHLMFVTNGSSVKQAVSPLIKLKHAERWNKTFQQTVNNDLNLVGISQNNEKELDGRFGELKG